jgi:ATP-dependent Lon protease
VKPVPPEQLRWRCPRLSFNDTRDVQPVTHIVGQESAHEALSFGLSVDAKGHNVFVRGHAGTGRLTLVKEVLQQVQLQIRPPLDHLYLLDPDRPDTPELVSVPAGTGRRLKERLDELIRFIREDLADLAQTESLLERTFEIEAKAAEELGKLTGPFEEALAEAGLVLVQLEDEDGDEETVIALLVGEDAVSVDQIPALVATGALTREEGVARRAAVERYSQQLRRLQVKVTRVRKRTHHKLQREAREAVAQTLADAVADLRREVPQIRSWLDKVVVEVSKHLGVIRENPEAAERYKANLLVERDPDGPRPLVLVTVPTFQSLVGSVDVPGDGPPHLGISAGALLQADGGYLVVEAADLVSEPGAWRALTRTLRSGLLELAPQDPPGTTQRSSHIRPEPIPVSLKVVLIGDPALYYALDEADDDLALLFKVLADFDDVLERDAAGIQKYAQVISGIAQRGKLPPFTAGAVAALVEHGVRVASEEGKLTARFARIADIAREGAFLARKRKVDKVHRQDIEQAVMAGRRRADMPGRRFRERVASGAWRIETTGRRVGQINGLAVIQAGPLVYGFPSRITATVGPGTDGTVHVEREAQLSGQIHTKGFYILQGLLRHLLDSEVPQAFDASITHEQSYGGIDGDSASGAELCALVSALTRIPARQGVAMTGAIDQFGNVMPIGAVNEKIEGFFDTCAAGGLDGQQAVIVPQANVRDLMLRRDVAEACRAGRFAVYGVERIEDALQHFLDTDIEQVVAAARQRIDALWQVSKPS